MALANLQPILFHMFNMVELTEHAWEPLAVIEHLHTQSHTASLSHFSLRVCFVVSCPGGGYDESANNIELRPAGRQSHGPLKEERE